MLAIHDVMILKFSERMIWNMKRWYKFGARGAK
jgi:hypothetical protein